MATSLSICGNGILLQVLTLALSFELIDCSGSHTEPSAHQTVLSADVAPGVVLVDVLGIGVLESGQPEHYYQYEVQPTNGLVRKTKEERFQDYRHEDIPNAFYQPSGAIESCRNDPQASSLDGEYLVYCRKAESDEFFVEDRKTSKTLYHGALGKGRGIRGFAWAPNSHSVAFLNVSSRLGKSPVELFPALSGHPVPHDTVFLNVLDLRTGQITEYSVRRDVPSSSTRILSWSE